MGTEDENFIISFKCRRAGVHIKELKAGDNSEIYSAYRKTGAVHMESPRDEFYLMDGADVIFIGSRKSLLGFVNSNF